MILTARKVFLILVFSFNLVHLPFITAIFSFLVVWSVLGKAWAIAVSVITSIPDWIQSAYQMIGAGYPVVNAVMSCASLPKTLAKSCIGNLFNLQFFGFVFNPLTTPTFEIPPVLLVLLAIALAITVFIGVRDIVRIKNRIRKTVAGLYGFEPFKRSEDSNP